MVARPVGTSAAVGFSVVSDPRVFSFLSQLLEPTLTLFISLYSLINITINIFSSSPLLLQLRWTQGLWIAYPTLQAQHFFSQYQGDELIFKAFFTCSFHAFM